MHRPRCLRHFDNVKDALCRQWKGDLDWRPDAEFLATERAADVARFYTQDNGFNILSWEPVIHPTLGGVITYLGWHESRGRRI